MLACAARCQQRKWKARYLARMRGNLFNGTLVYVFACSPAARLEKMFDKWNNWRKNKTMRYDFHVFSLSIVWWSCSLNFIYSCNVFCRYLRLNTHISSSNISAQPLPKEGEKHHFFQERNHQKNLTTWLLKKDIAEEKSCTCSTRRQNAFVHTWHWSSYALVLLPNFKKTNVFFFIIWFDFDYWRTQMIILPQEKNTSSLTSKLVFETSSPWIIAKFIMSNKLN